MIMLNYINIFITDPFCSIQIINSRVFYSRECVFVFPKILPHLD